jgi:hypothetical protein
LLTAGCKAVERAAVAPLPDDAAPMPFADLTARARAQAMAANEAFYVDNWPAIEEAARGLEQTARFLKRAQNVPAARAADVDSRSDLLLREAAALRQAAAERNIQQINAILQRIHYQIRELRN